MDRKSAIDLAKRHLVDSIYASVKVEGLGITFPETQQILDNCSVQAKPNDIMFVLNMREAWRFLLDTLDAPVNLMYLRELNKRCGNGLIYGCGALRETNVSITGCNYVPKIPQHGEVVDKLARLDLIPDTLEKAIMYFQYVARAQLFVDGNKRVAQLVANKILIADGYGILKIPDTKVQEFATVLVSYYENEDDLLARYLTEKCVIKAVELELISYKGMNFTVNEILGVLPPSVISSYASRRECAEANIEMYYNNFCI